MNIEELQALQKEIEIAIHDHVEDAFEDPHGLLERVECEIDEMKGQSRPWPATGQIDTTEIPIIPDIVHPSLRRSTVGKVERASPAT